MTRGKYAAAALAAALLAVTCASAAAATPPPPVLAGHAAKSATLCGARDWRPVDQGRYDLRNDVYGAGVTQCVTTAGRSSFRVTSYQRAGTGLVGSYPDLFTGCDMWGVCTKDTPLPLPVRRLRKFRQTWHTAFPRRAQDGNDSDDIWFTKGDPDGPASSRAELMVWLGSTHVRTVTFATVRLARYRWKVATWITTDHQGHFWRYIQFRTARPRLRVTNLNLLPLVRYAMRHGWIRRGWDLSSACAGFEIWHGGRGDAVRHLWFGIAS